MDLARAIGFDAALASPVIPWLARDAFADADAEGAQRGFVAVPGGKPYWEVAGDGPPLILIHGDGLDRTLWDPQVPALARHFRLVRYDLRGHGRSVPIDAGESFLHAEDLVRLMDGLHIREAHLAGLALGGAIVADMLALHPERMLSGVVASADPGALAPDADGPSRDLWDLKRDRLDRLTDHGGSRVASVRPALWRMLSKWQGPRAGTGKSPPVLGEAAHALLKGRAPDLPVLILTPELTAHRPSALLPLLPRARQEIIADTGYFANLEQPRAFDEALLRFLT
jgi:pimeloyl-ACP methyl ester carboxylesterase